MLERRSRFRFSRSLPAFYALPVLCGFGGFVFYPAPSWGRVVWRSGKQRANGKSGKRAKIENSGQRFRRVGRDSGEIRNGGSIRKG